jgi:hypothetical protein
MRADELPALSRAHGDPANRAGSRFQNCWKEEGEPTASVAISDNCLSDSSTNVNISSIFKTNSSKFTRKMYQLVTVNDRLYGVVCRFSGPCASLLKSMVLPLG